MTSERIKEIQKTTAYPDSVGVMLALNQVWNECAQEQGKEIEELRAFNTSLILKIDELVKTANSFINK
jgi:hypothetical protein